MKVNNLVQVHVVRQMSKSLKSVLVDSEGRSKILNQCIKYPFKVKLYLKILTRYFLILTAGQFAEGS